ncbi:jg28012 [Pararge aegeria aegeria]|uniref:Jg28012 protein n=1 Tax=Pararge aegeria aegeria TaxID=348720 RepID=A0A8S4QR15_9NEOP|nr:jg28012 [Pararge aegeria aegeria]
MQPKLEKAFHNLSLLLNWALVNNRLRNQSDTATVQKVLFHWSAADEDKASLEQQTRMQDDCLGTHERLIVQRSVRVCVCPCVQRVQSQAIRSLGAPPSFAFH